MILFKLFAGLLVISVVYAAISAVLTWLTQRCASWRLRMSGRDVSKLQETVLFEEINMMGAFFFIAFPWMILAAISPTLVLESEARCRSILLEEKRLGLAERITNDGELA